MQLVEIAKPSFDMVTRRHLLPSQLDSSLNLDAQSAAPIGGPTRGQDEVYRCVRTLYVSM